MFVRNYWFYGPQAATAVLTGTAVPSATETEIVASGETIIITLTNDTWVAAGAAFDAQRQAIINGITSAQSEPTGWNAKWKTGESPASVIRTSDTVVTITGDDIELYDITVTETITVTVPGTALTGGIAIVATPTFDVTTTISDIVRDIIMPGIIPFARA